MNTIKFRQLGILVFTSLVFLSLFLSLVSAESNSPMPFIGDDDDYVVNVSIGSTHKFNWTVYRNSSQNYVVSVSASGLSSWAHRLSKDYFIIDEVNPYQVVGLSIDIPQYPQERDIQGVVTFTFRPLNETERFSIEKTFSISVTGIYTGEENTLVGGFPNPLPFPLNNPIGAFILNILIWAAIAVLFYVFFKRIVMVLVKKTETLFDDMIVEIIRKPALLIIILYGFLHSLMKLDFHVGLIATLNNAYMIILIFTILYVSYRIFDEILNELTIKKGGKFSTFGTVVKPIFRKIGLSVIIIGGVIYALRYIGFDVTALLAGAGVAGLVIAFAAQDTLSNFFSGMHLLLDRPFRIGDVILLETGEYCRVENVGMRSTKLYCIFTHELIVLPNNSIANQKIVNVVKPDARIRKRIEVGVAYGSDIEKVKRILMDVALSHKNVVNEPGFEPLIRFIDFGDSSLDFRLIIWIEDVMKQWKVLSDLRFEIDKQFRKELINIPFPQRTVWLNTVKDQPKEEENKDNIDKSNNDKK